jgi:hypothetical protein
MAAASRHSEDDCTPPRSGLCNPRSTRPDLCEAVDPRIAQPHHPPGAGWLSLDAWRLSRLASSTISQGLGQGCRKSPPHLRHPARSFYSAMVTVNARPNAVALETITEPHKCPIRTPACHRDICGRQKLLDFSACPGGPWKSTEPTARVPPIGSSADASSNRRANGDPILVLSGTKIG